MQIQAHINEDHTEAALSFPEPNPGYTITMTADQVDQLITILIDLRNHMDPPPEMPVEVHRTRQMNSQRLPCFRLGRCPHSAITELCNSMYFREFAPAGHPLA